MIDHLTSAAPAAIAGARLAIMPDGARSFPAVLQGHMATPGARLATAAGYDATTRTVELITATETPVRMPGWLVGLNLSNRDKMGIIRTACDVFGVTMPDELNIELPNAS